MPSDVSEVLKPTLDKFSKMTEKIGIDDFILVKTLGRGTFGKVMLVQKKDNKKYYAMKSIRKENILEPEALQHTKLERIILEKIDSPFLVKLEIAFQTAEKLFFVLDFK